MTAPYFHILLSAGATAQTIETLISLKLQIYPNWGIMMPRMGMSSEEQSMFQRQVGASIQWLNENDVASKRIDSDDSYISVSYTHL